MRRMTTGALALLLVALTACAAVSPQGRGYRRADTQIASAALFNPARFVGVWHVVAAYGAGADCGPLAETWVQAGPQAFSVTGTRCGAAGARDFAARAVMSGPGRITRGAETLWVQWVDADYRVAVIGTPDGSFGRILSRTADLRGDLMTAARSVLDFNGYDLAASRLTEE